MNQLMAIITPVILKTTGALFRIYSVPTDTPELKNLRKTIAQQEFSVVGLVLASSTALNAAFKMLPLKYRSNPVAQLAPQVAAYVFSEMVSRKMTNLKENFKNAVVPQTNLHVDAKVNTNTEPRIMPLPAPRPVLKETPYDVYFQARKTPGPVTVRGFY